MDSGKANSVGQPLVQVLNQASLLLSHVDYYVKKMTNQLNDIQLRMVKESTNEGWGTEDYVQNCLKITM